MAGKRHCKSFTKVNRKRKRVSVYVFASILRKRMTKAEVMLWRKLQIVMKQWGVVFESQGVVAGRYIADFICRDKRLIVEIDGSIHRLNRVKAKDRYRSVVLMKLGYQVLRFDNRDVFTDCLRVLKDIRNSITP